MPKVWNKRDPSIPKDAIYVGRPTKWGNPYKVEAYGRAVSIELYQLHLLKLYHQGVLNPKELKGKDLVCWCAPEACHADVLLEIANK